MVGGGKSVLPPRGCLICIRLLPREPGPAHRATRLGQLVALLRVQNPQIRGSGKQKKNDQCFQRAKLPSAAHQGGGHIAKAQNASRRRAVIQLMPSQMRSVKAVQGETDRERRRCRGNHLSVLGRVTFKRPTLGAPLQWRICLQNTYIYKRKRSFLLLFLAAVWPLFGLSHGKM